MLDTNKYAHLTEENLADATDIKELMKDLDESTQMLVMVYARGLRDMQESNKRTA